MQTRPDPTGDGAAGPLAGLRVIDWTHVLAGPVASYQLGLLGAEVVRIERADADDMVRARAADPALGPLGLAETFVAQGAGKRSLAVDARDPRARRALAALIAGADVLVENFRPGKLAALGFDPAALVEAHPRLVVCSITGFGPGSARRAYDHVVQAASGLMAAQAEADGRPQRIAFPVVDYTVGQQAAQAVLAALLRRERQGAARRRGEWLQLSMLDAALTLLAPVYAAPLVSGIEPARSAATAFSGSPLSGTFACADGAHLALVCNTVDQAQGLLRALAEAGRPAAPDGAAEAGGAAAAEAAVAALGAAARARDAGTAQALLARLLAARGAADWEARLAAHGVPAATVRRAADAARDAAARWPEVALALPGGPRRVPVPGVGWASSEPLTGPLAAPPRRGADTRALLAEAGLDAATIGSMLADGTAHAPP